MGVDLLPGIQRRIGSTRIRVPESRIHEAVAVRPPADRLKANSRDRSIDELARLKVEHMQRVVLAAVLADRECYVSRSEEHTSDLQSLMRISYAVFCLKK